MSFWCTIVTQMGSDQFWINTELTDPGIKPSPVIKEVDSIIPEKHNNYWPLVINICVLDHHDLFRISISVFLFVWPHIHDLLGSHVHPDHLLLRLAAQVVLAADVAQDRVRPSQFHLKQGAWQRVGEKRPWVSGRCKLDILSNWSHTHCCPCSRASWGSQAPEWTWRPSMRSDHRRALDHTERGI